ncbi:methylmalonyl Co-A mutase-associated GTPase MeaB [Bacteroidota bacterium]
MGKKIKKPEWAPENSGDEFASRILKGVSNLDNMNLRKNNSKTLKLSLPDYVRGVKEDNRSILARTITLIESNSKEHIIQAQEVLKELLPFTGQSIRIGITGAPGVGKSTFIESFGSYLCENRHKVAVLAIDPSSSRSKGSILGDKTRMERLSRHPNAFIRPSPSSGTLGGVARKTRETTLVCEAAGFDVILIETIGVGQSEITVRSMVDFYLLLILPGGGDELQGIKKGVVELADMLVINKADGDNLQKAKITQHSYSDALHYLLPATEGWTTEAVLTSAIYDEGIGKVWNNIEKFIKTTKETGIFNIRRKRQLLEWVYTMVDETLLNRFYFNNEISNIKDKIDKQVLNGEITPTNAVNILLEKEERKRKKG